MEDVVEAANSWVEKLAESIKSELEIITIPSVVPNQNKLRVPAHIKQLNPEAYKPRMISIGPVHHGQRELIAMEAFKRRHAASFIKRYEISIDALIHVTKECEDRLREDYAMDSSVIPSEELVKIMLIDGAFLVMFIIRVDLGDYEEIDNFKSDLFLLENQIPLYYLDKVLNFAERGTLADQFPWFLRLTTPYFFCSFRNEMTAWYFVCLLNERNQDHLLDCLRNVMWLGEREKKQSKPLCFPLCMWLGERGKNKSKSLSFQSCPTITQLHRGGIKIRPNKGGTMEITFRRNRILQLPRLTIDHNTGRYFANLLASELFQTEDCYATDYVAMMDYLIDGPEDVRILVKKGIIQNLLKDDEAVSNLINEIGGTIDARPDFYYSHMVKDLRVYSENRWIKWKSRHYFEWKRDLKRNYFRNPWRTLSVIAAIILLGLTITQTVCSILQLKNPTLP